MKAGDDVIVTNMDNVSARGTIEAVSAVYCSEFVDADWLPDGASLAGYWRGYDIDPEEFVVHVDLDGQTYAYPISRVEVIDDD